MRKKHKDTKARKSFEAFRLLFSRRSGKCCGRRALMSDRKAVAIHPAGIEEWREKIARYKDNLFSAQEITGVPLD